MTLAVIGRGLWGAAAARHLAQAGHEVLLIGPGEPEPGERRETGFGSHWDEGRIVRQTDGRPFWAEAARASIARYREIEAASGIGFFTEAGGLMAGPAGGRFMTAHFAEAAAAGTPVRRLEGADLAAAFPAFRFPGGFVALHEAERAGHLSPRKMVAAQTEAARRAGARVLAETVTDIGEDGDGVLIATEAGTHRAARALVACGGMTGHVLGADLGLRVWARTIVFFHLDAEEAGRLATLPPLAAEWSDGTLPYLLPPIRYPDGSVRLKIGGDPIDIPLGTASEIRNWFHGNGHPEVRGHLTLQARALIPGLAAREVTTGACMTTYTPDGTPVLRRLSPRLVALAGGNGIGAKSSDEIGRRGAMALLAGT